MSSAPENNFSLFLPPFSQMCFHSQLSEALSPTWEPQTLNDHPDDDDLWRYSTHLLLNATSKVNSWLLVFFVIFYLLPLFTQYLKLETLFTSHLSFNRSPKFYWFCLLKVSGIHTSFPFLWLSPWSSGLFNIFSGPQLASPPFSFPAPIYSDCYQIKLPKLIFIPMSFQPPNHQWLPAK